MASITDKLLKSQFSSNLQKQQDIFEKNAEKQAKKEGNLSSFMKIATPLAGLALMATPLGPLMATAGSALGGSLGLGAAASTALGTGIAKAGTSYLGSLASEEGARLAGMGAASEEEQRKSLESQTANLGPIGREQMKKGLDKDLYVTQEKAREASGDSRALGALASGVTAGYGQYSKLADVGSNVGTDLAVDTGTDIATTEGAETLGTEAAQVFDPETGMPIVSGDPVFNPETGEQIGGNIMLDPIEVKAHQPVSLFGTDMGPGGDTMSLGEKFGEMGNIFDTSSDWWGMGTENWGETVKNLGTQEATNYFLKRQDGGIIPSVDARNRDNTDFYKLYL